ncbi:class I SAM-dependent methyltransferase [Paenibacillus turpanensis]|uniref:class I SAM-dependent methyltransferase n=1 Tax=Paenibacillus turpanensis TaxID=2689078 RepID=UPI00140CF6AE|nr:class I SAM-dependent methyltransferase [Paenibacillus turpanensis]
MNYLDLLAAMGTGDAHPGGFAATIEQFKRHPLPADAHILEIGCGTGRTACHLAQLGYLVTAIDLRRDMIEKAKIRAERSHTKVQFLAADAKELPFPRDSFDVVIAESVTIFAGAASIDEYYRVLKPGGVLYDREIVSIGSLSEAAQCQIHRFYGVSHLWGIDKWKEELNSRPFRRMVIEGPLPFPKNVPTIADPLQQSDPKLYEKPETWEIIAAYEEIMSAYEDSLGYALIVAVK